MTIPVDAVDAVPEDEDVITEQGGDTDDVADDSEDDDEEDDE